MVSGKISGTLLGRYRLAEVVGKGAMGIVARAHDKVLDRTVAIKLLKDEFAGDPATVERFRREALIAASLQHPGIAQVFDFGQENGRSFIVMEFLEGQDLHSMLASGKRFSIAAAAEIVARVAEALDHAHRAGTVHRDVKPGNIFITHSQQVKVTDFGIARAAGRAPLTRTGMVIGTFQYLSPEQVLGESVGPASDIYSLGCVLFELLTGRAPFEDDSMAALSMAHLSRPPPSARLAHPSISHEVDEVVLKCLAKEPESRHASGVEMATALREAAPSQSRAAWIEEIDALLNTDNSEIQRGAETVGSTEALKATRALEAGTESAWSAEAPPTRQGRRLKPMRPILALGVLAAAIIAFVLLANRDDSVEVPSWVGRNIDLALRQAEDFGLDIDQKEEDSIARAGEILRQDPEAGREVARGSVVTLYVSRGPELVAVPEVEGKKLDEATETLQRYGFQVEVIGDSQAEDAEVVAQDPGPLTLRPQGSTVRLTISEGKGKGRGKDED